MTSKELRFDLLTEIAYITESDDMMKEAIASLRQIRQDAAAKVQGSTDKTERKEV